MSRYKWAPVSYPEAAAFHLAACVSTSSSDKELIGADTRSSDKELIGADKACVLTRINSFHNRLMLHH